MKKSDDNRRAASERKPRKSLAEFVRHYLSFRSSIYARVVYIIGLLSLFLFISYSLIFKSVYEGYLRTVIRQQGDNIGSIVEGSLYHSMLKNDKSALQSTLDIINAMPGIDEVNMYNNRDSLVYSTTAFSDSLAQRGPNCGGCHSNFSEMFPAKQKSYRIIDFKSPCNMDQKQKGHRQLLVRTPILNERSCYASACHAHSQEEEILGSLIIKVPLAELDSAVTKSSTDFFLLAIVVTVLLVSLLIFFTKNKIQKPLNEIIVASEAVSKGDRSRRLEIRPHLLEDMRSVSLAFNNMLDNLDAANRELENWSHQLEYKVQRKSEELAEIQNELIHIERITSLGKLSSSVAHEINNPLSGILTYSKLVAKQLAKLDMPETSKASMLKYLKVIETESKRCGNIVRGLLDFSRKDQENFEQHHLNQVLKESYSLMAHQMHIAGIHFYTDFTASSDLVYCNDNQIKQVCVALLVNAMEAITLNGEILIKTSNPDEEHIKMEIVDNGVGIPAEDISRIFQPFYSAKQRASGIGLGLAIVHGIVQSHKGKIEVQSEPGKGTTMSVLFNLVTKEDQ
ncbi:HAMP domain-containing protein [Maribellus luteus]|uniref:histidine kinase n=1 Tax=Maribellus luteus TaxID=2305463 RepID=A0A399SWA2_9BACT|nr:HAMP domain-containing sensor histidine kinase [Maribellus luteus]RIJ48316.1 HAMP domain-containing protein [Maribellus luteus]